MDRTAWVKQYISERGCSRQAAYKAYSKEFPENGKGTPGRPRVDIHVNRVNLEQLRKDVDALSEMFELIESIDRRVSKLEDLAERRR